MLTCPPRRLASRGEPSEKPCGSSHSSVSAITISVSATALARIAPIPASAITAAPSRTARMPSTAGVPDIIDRIPGGRQVSLLHLERIPAAEPTPDRLVEVRRGAGR